MAEVYRQSKAELQVASPVKSTLAEHDLPQRLTLFWTGATVLRPALARRS